MVACRVCSSATVSWPRWMSCWSVAVCFWSRGGRGSARRRCRMKHASARPGSVTRCWTRVGPSSRPGSPGSARAGRQVTRAELADVRVFGAPRALGVASRVAGLAESGTQGLELLRESVASFRDSPARLELAHSLTELGAALRRSWRARSRSCSASGGLELSVRCGARRLAARARAELRATGSRPRRAWRRGEALTVSYGSCASPPRGRPTGRSPASSM